MEMTELLDCSTNCLAPILDVYLQHVSKFTKYGHELTVSWIVK